MALLAGNITALLSFKIKPRHDDYTDQVSRICVVKILIVSSLVMGIDWFHDSVSCLPPKYTKESQNIPMKFLESTCWIQGFYVFPDLTLEKSSYYGIPLNLHLDGVSQADDLCGTVGRLYQVKKTTTCRPMKRRYLSQYQWMPFCIASLALLFYSPYIMFRVVNTDMISLKANLVDKVSKDEIVSNYFDHGINSVPKMRMRVVSNFVIKLLYLFVNLFAFLVLNGSLDDRFMTYGTDWIRWKRLNSTLQMDFELRSEPKPGNRMLPTFGLCDITDTRIDATTVYQNKVKVVCEISTHILYHYVFLILWFIMVLSISISCLGVVCNIFGHINNLKFSKENSLKNIYKYLTLRECEYLEFIRRRDLATYGTVLKKLRRMKTFGGFGNTQNGTIQQCEDNHEELANLNFKGVPDG